MDDMIMRGKYDAKVVTDFGFVPKPDDMISRAAAIDALKRAAYWQDAERKIAELPAVDAVPVVHAYWVDCSEGNDGTVCRKCSACKDMQIYYYKYYPNYCPGCGAKMDGERRDSE